MKLKINEYLNGKWVNLFNMITRDDLDINKIQDDLKNGRTISFENMGIHVSVYITANGPVTMELE